MTHRLAILALPFALAACTATAAGSITPSTSPSKAPSTTASKSPSADPSTPAADGTDKVTLTIDGKARTLTGPVRWTPTDLLGSRLRISAAIGPDSPAGDEANVGFLFGGGGKTMLPGWDTTNSGAVFSVQVNYFDAARNTIRGMALTTNTSSGDKTNLVAKDGHITGKLEGEAFPSTGSLSEENKRVPFKLEFDLVQPPLASKM